MHHILISFGCAVKSTAAQPLSAILPVLLLKVGDESLHSPRPLGFSSPFPPSTIRGNVVLWFPLDLFKLLLLYFLPAGMPPAGVIVVFHLVPSEDPCTTS